MTLHAAAPSAGVCRDTRLKFKLKRLKQQLGLNVSSYLMHKEAPAGRRRNLKLS